MESCLDPGGYGTYNSSVVLAERGNCVITLFFLIQGVTSDLRVSGVFSHHLYVKAGPAFHRDCCVKLGISIILLCDVMIILFLRRKL